MSQTEPTGLKVEFLADRHDRKLLRSGSSALDRYFETQAGQDVRKRVASCFVLVRGGEAKPIGFYTLAATSIALADLPQSLTSRLPRYPQVPAVLMGRLAVDAAHHGRGFGEFLLLDAFSRALRSEVAVFAFLVDAKDDTAAAFYAAHGLRQLAADRARMFITTAAIATLFI